jgi:hypothetical protein
LKPNAPFFLPSFVNGNRVYFVLNASIIVMIIS